MGARSDEHAPTGNIPVASVPGTDGATNSGVIDAPPLGGFVEHPAALINVINSDILYIGDDNTAGEDGVILDSTTQQFITTRASSFCLHGAPASAQAQPPSYWAY